MMNYAINMFTFGRISLMIFVHWKLIDAFKNFFDVNWI